MKATRVQAPTPALSASAGSNAFSVSWTQATVAGNLLIMGLAGRGVTSYTAPATWVELGPAGGLLISAATMGQLWYIEGSASRSGAETITLVGSGRWIGWLAEYSGVVTSGALDQKAAALSTATSTTAAASGTTASVASNAGLAVALLVKNNSTESFLSAPTNSFSIVGGTQVTANGTASSNVVGQYLDLVGVLTGGQSTSEAFSATAGSARDIPGIIASFKLLPNPRTLVGIGA